MIYAFVIVHSPSQREGPERLPLSGRKNPINIFSMENSHEYNDTIVIFDPNPIISLSNSIIMFISSYHFQMVDH